MAHLPFRQNDLLAAQHLASLFRDRGWRVDLEPGEGPRRPDLVARKGSLRYAIELKCMAEGRPDRALALLSQAILQARRHAEDQAMRPLAVLHVAQVAPSLYGKLEQFHRDYAADVAVGLVSDAGGRLFIGRGLEALNAEPPRGSGKNRLGPPRKAWDLFSDLNQWMLKVLLAPELPEGLLRAPRGEYRTGSELADAARVSAMSASRFVRRLKEEGFLEDSGGAMRLVRRRELFRRWQSAAMRSSPELQMAFLIPGGERRLRTIVPRLDACVGLFAAAEYLGLRHVRGVAPYLYVRRIRASSGEDWPGLVPSKPGEPPQVVLRQASAPESLFRGAVQIDGMPVSDVLQIWLDAAAHPSRGAEQADLIEKKVLADVLGTHE